MSTAYERRIPRRSKNSTAGSRPAARNSATTISISVEPIAWICMREPERDQDAEAAEEADEERRVVVERRPRLAEVVVDRRRIARRSAPRSGRRRWRGSGASVTPRPRRSPATTSRSEASWAVIASRRLVIRSTSARIAASSRSASAVAGRGDRLGLGARRGHDLLGLAAGPAEQRLGLGLRPGCGARWPGLVASRARSSAAAARSSASSTRRLVSAIALAWWSVASRASRSFSTASVRRASWTSRSAAARCCSASRVAVVRSSLVSCSAASRSWSASRLAAATRSSASLRASAPLLLGVGHQPGAVLVELLELDQPHVLGLAGRVGADRLGVAGGLVADLVRRRARRSRGPRRPPPRRAAASRWRGRRGRRTTGSAARRARPARCGDLLLELERAALGLAEAAAQAGLLAAELADPGVDRVLVVAAAAHHRERAGRRRAGRRRGAAGGLRRGWAARGAGARGGIAGRRRGRPAAAGALGRCGRRLGSAGGHRQASPGWRPRRRGGRVLVRLVASKMDSPWSLIAALLLVSVAVGRAAQSGGSTENNPPRPATICRRTGVDRGVRSGAQTPRKRLIASRCCARISSSRTPRPSSGARQRTPTLPWWVLWWTSSAAWPTSSRG